MNPLETALSTISENLEQLKIPYMVIGGMANAVWGEPRATLDVDVTIWVKEEYIQTLISHLSDHFILLTEKPFEFVKKTRVLPIKTKDGVNIDLIWGLLPYEEQAIKRAVAISLGDKTIKFCTAEDLILHKIISTREKDRADVKQIIIKNKHSLDNNYLEPHIRQLAELLERPEIWEFWKTQSTK